MTADMGNEPGHDLDIDGPEEFDQGPVEKPSLKEAWQNNPLLKIAAAILVIAVVIGGYMTYTKPNPVDESKSMVRVSKAADVKAAPGQENFDAKYKEAIQKKNEQNAKVATVTGGSAIPITVTTGKAQTLDVPQAAGAQETDPLKEWKQTVQTHQLKVEAPHEEEAPPAPASDLVPMVTPVRPQPAAAKMDPKAATALAAQMRTIIATQVPGGAKHLDVTREKTAYVAMEDDQKDAAKNGGAKGQASSSSSHPGPNGSPAADVAAGKVIVPAGQIAYAQLLTELNSDVPAPVLATVLSGPFTGARAMGKMTTQDEYIVITFDRFIKDTVSYRINGIALDEDTTLPALETGIDHHYFERIILPAAAQFVSGYGTAISQPPTSSTITSGGAVAQSTPQPTAKDSLFKGLAGASATAGQVIQEDAKTKPTIHVARGTTMGVLFLDTVRTTDADK